MLHHLMLLLLCSAALAQDAPLRYECRRATTPIRVDGRLDDAAWKDAPWTAAFVDIEGDAKTRPRFQTRVKLLWDDRFLYIAAEME